MQERTNRPERVQRRPGEGKYPSGKGGLDELGFSMAEIARHVGEWKWGQA